MPHSKVPTAGHFDPKGPGNQAGAFEVRRQPLQCISLPLAGRMAKWCFLSCSATIVAGHDLHNGIAPFSFEFCQPMLSSRGRASARCSMLTVQQFKALMHVRAVLVRWWIQVNFSGVFPQTVGSATRGRYRCGSPREHQLDLSTAWAQSAVISGYGWEQKFS